MNLQSLFFSNNEQRLSAVIDSRNVYKWRHKIDKKLPSMASIELKLC